MTCFVYVSAWESDSITVFALSPGDGRLERVHEVAVHGRPAPLAIDPAQRFLFVGRRGDNAIASYGIDPIGGGLSEIAAVEVPSDPCFLSTDRAGRYLLSAYYMAGRVAVHSIGADGSLNRQPVQWRETGTGAHCMRTDPSNRFAFVPHIANRGGPNAIFQFVFDAETGRLTANSPDRIAPENPDGPRHICFHPSRDFVYSSNEQGCSVTVYELDRSFGTLSAVQTVSTLPDDYAGDSTCSQIQITPCGRFLYAPNRGHDSIAAFAVDSDNARLSPLGYTSADPVPRAIGLDPGGRHLFVAGLHTGRLASHRIDLASGALQLIETHNVGHEPMWILIAEPRRGDHAQT